jgi:alpha-beta hydrolase superfamily lysophospholipase
MLRPLSPPMRVPRDAATLQGRAGSLYVRSWRHEEPSHVVVISHGYGEHIGRYDHVAAAFGEHGAAVYGLDHVGHGRSDGERALIADFNPVVDDLHLLVQRARAEHAGLPLVVVGHSMGGLIATRYAQRHRDGLAGLVLSAPLLGNPGSAFLLAMDPLPEIPIDPAVLSRDESVGKAYRADPLNYHGGFKRPTLAAMAVAILDAALDCQRITGPVLWQHGEADELVPMAGSERQIALLTNADVSRHIYPGARHEIFNETNRQDVLADTTRFIDAAVPSRHA